MPSLLDELQAILSKLRYVKAGDIVLSEDHNTQNDALYKIKEILEDHETRITNLEQAGAPTPTPTPTISAPWPTYRHDFKRTAYQPNQPKYILINCEYYWFILLKIDGSVYFKDYNNVGSYEASPIVDDYGNIYLPLDDSRVYVMSLGGVVKEYVVLEDVVLYGLTFHDDKVYIPTQAGGLHIIDISTKERITFYAGDYIYTAPAIDENGVIYFGSIDYYFYALNPDGTLKWKYYIGDEVRGSPALLSDGTIVTTALDNCVYAFKPDGTLKWRYCTGDWIMDCAAIDPDDIIYVASLDNYVYAIKPDGTLKWRYYLGDYATPSRPPAIDPNRGIYVSDTNGNLHAIDFNGNVKWTYSIGDEGRITIGPDGTIYVVVGSTVYAINPDGTLKWKTTIDYSASSEPVLVG